MGTSNTYDETRQAYAPVELAQRYSGRVVALALAGGIIAGAGIAMALANALEPADAVTLRACQTEDSIQCYWRADVFGNGEGRSYVDLNGHFYVEQTPYADRD